MSGNLYAEAYQILSSIFVLRPRNEHSKSFLVRASDRYGTKVIKLEYSLKLKIKHNNWLIEDTCLQAANQFALF